MDHNCYYSRPKLNPHTRTPPLLTRYNSISLLFTIFITLKSHTPWHSLSYAHVLFFLVSLEADSQKRCLAGNQALSSSESLAYPRCASIATTRSYRQDNLLAFSLILKCCDQIILAMRHMTFGIFCQIAGFDWNIFIKYSDVSSSNLRTNQRVYALPGQRYE